MRIDTRTHIHTLGIHSNVGREYLKYTADKTVAVPLTNNDKWMQYAKSEQVAFGYKRKKIASGTIMGCVCSPVSQLRWAELRLMAYVKIKKCVGECVRCVSTKSCACVWGSERETEGENLSDI